MERTRINAEQVVQEEPSFRFQKLGGGSLRLGKRIIKPGEKFRAKMSEIPKAFLNVLLPLENIPEESPVAGKKEPVVTPTVVVKPEYMAVEIENPSGRKDLTYFNVVDKNGKVLNEKPLTEAKATKLISDLLL